MKQPDLALTLEGIANVGSSFLYQGELAKLISRDLQNNGGLLTYQYFINHRSDWVDPISVRYRGYQVYNVPPNSQGFASLSILNIINNFELSYIEEGSADHYHLLTEAIFIAILTLLILEKWKVHPAFVIVGGLVFGAIFLV